MLRTGALGGTYGAAEWVETPDAKVRIDLGPWGVEEVVVLTGDMMNRRALRLPGEVA